MKLLTIYEQDLAIGGNGALSGAIGTGVGAAAFGGSSPECAVLGALTGSAVTAAMGFTPMGGYAGAFISAGVTAACNNPRSYPSIPSPGGSSGRSAGYWPSVGGGSNSFSSFGSGGGGGGGGSSKFQFLMCMAAK